MKSSVKLLLGALAPFLLAPVATWAQDAASDAVVKVGVLAKRGDKNAVEMWGPTVEYLNQAVPGYRFQLEALDFHEFNESVARDEVQFVIGNPGQYVQFEAKYDAVRIATLKNVRQGKPYTVFGGVIFCRADREDIHELADLRGKTFLAVDETSLGGWQMAWRELKEAKIDPYRNFRPRTPGGKPIEFAGTHDAVVYAVLNGEVDAGTVRTDTLERMEEEGKIQRTDFRILNPQPKTKDFPFDRSTRLYPEWPFVVTKNTPQELAEKVMAALLQMPKDSPAAKAAKCQGWTIPLSYQPVHECLRALGVSPYQNYGKVALRQVISQYRWWIGAALAGLLLLAVVMARTWQLNHRLKNARESLQHELAEHERAEAQVRELATRTRLIVDAAQDAFVGMDAEGRITDWNPQAEVTFGWSREEALGRVLAETLVPPQHRQAHRQGLTRFLAAGEGPVLNRRIELTAMHRDGREFPVELTISPIRRDGTYLFGAFIHDITGRKQTQQDLQQAKEAAEAASRAKSEFLANMSHEIRTPLNGVIGMTELALDTRVTPEQREYLTMARASADALSAVINDILDFSKIEARKLELDAVEFGLRDTLGDVMKVLALRAEQKGLELACHVPAIVPDVLVGDPVRLGQVLINLAGNAIKFTDRGEVIVHVQAAREAEAALASGDRATLLEFTVRDTGIGIRPEKQRLIFDPFAQADTSTTRKYGGTGLGLTISTQLVELMGGRIWVESEPGVGSQFHFTARFGLARDDEAQAPTARPTSLHGLVALVVDDNATNRRILEEMLTHWGLRPILAESGPNALALLDKAVAAGEPCPLVLVDGHMPEMDGFDLATRIRARPDLAGTAILMLTSAGRAGDIARCRELAINAYLMKPVKQSDVFDAIFTALGQPLLDEAAQATADAVPWAGCRPLRVLLAEDNMVNQKLAVRLLEKQGHAVTLVSNGREALAALGIANGEEAIDSAHGHPFDLVLLDVQMPEIDGLETARRIRLHEAGSGRHVPILAMTAHAMKGDRERCLASGMDGYVAKPVQPRELYAALATAVQGQAAATPRDAGISQAAAGGNGLAVLDRADALEHVAGDLELLRELAAEFLRGWPAERARLRSAIEHGDPQAIMRLAHAIKGAVGNLGAKAAFAAADRLEAQADAADLASTGQLADDLERAVEQLPAALEALVA